MTLGYIYGWVSVATGAYMLLFTLANILYLKRVSHPAVKTSGPLVSVLIPARNEAMRIGPALEALRNQDYDNYEVIVLDDNSEDSTWNVVNEKCGDDPRFRILRGRSLEQGWKGKPFAMAQLAESADGEILIFIDADMRPQPSLLSWTVTNLEDHGVDFLSGYPRHTAPESIEYLLFPVMYLATSFLLPLWLFRHSRTYMFSHAIGQFFCVRSAVLKESGGLAAVKNKINEDIQLARHLKNCGYKQVFLDAKKQILGNMYDSIPHAKMGVMRVIYEYFDNLVYPFLFMGFVILLFLLLPPLVAIFALAAAAPWAWLCVLSVVLVLGAWSIAMINRDLPGILRFYTRSSSDGHLFFRSDPSFFQRKARGIYGKAVSSADCRIQRQANTQASRLLFHPSISLDGFGTRVWAQDKGRKHLRRCEAAVTAMNHCQYLEWFFMCHAAWPRAVRFSMEEANIRRKDIGWANRLMGGFGIPEDQPMAMAPAVGKLLNNGELVHFFPEGVLKYRNPIPDGFSVGAAWFACRYNVPLIPVTEVLLERPLRKIFSVVAPEGSCCCRKALNPRDFGGMERRLKDKARDMTSNLLNIMQQTIARYGNGFPVYQ